jgi:ribosome biogenesis GTPase
MNLEQLGWRPAFESSFANHRSEGHLPARIAREDRGGYVAYTGERALRAAVSGSFRHAAAGRADFPAVGDWAVVRPRRGQDAATIVSLLPRESVVRRKAAGERSEQQILAANVDLLLICCGLDRDFNLRRIERYLTVAYDSGVAPLVLLNKADACDTPEQLAGQVEDIAIGVPVLVASARDGRGIDALRAHLGSGRTAALVGSSGVGKSTLINRLLGREELATGHTRASVGRGRHTTTWRQLLLLPGGGVIIDTPGMRELALWGESDAVDDAFADIDALASGCRFRDCAHQSEPGCAVRAAVELGELDPARLDSYRKQQRELRYLAIRDDAGAQAAQRARWKTIHKAARKRMDEKYGR